MRNVERLRDAQQAILVRPEHCPDARFSVYYRPLEEAGGDFYDVVEFPDGKIVFCIADITAKGVAAALLMANFQANFRALVARRPTLEELVQEMNAAVFRVTQGDRHRKSSLPRHLAGWHGVRQFSRARRTH